MAAAANNQQRPRLFNEDVYIGAVVLGAGSGEGAAWLTAASSVGGALCGAVAVPVAFLFADATRDINIPAFENQMLNGIGKVLNVVLRMGISACIGASVGVDLAGLAGYVIAETTVAATAAIALGILACLIVPVVLHRIYLDLHG